MPIPVQVVGGHSDKCTIPSIKLGSVKCQYIFQGIAAYIIRWGGGGLGQWGGGGVNSNY